MTTQKWNAAKKIENTKLLFSGRKKVSFQNNIQRKQNGGRNNHFFIKRKKRGESNNRRNTWPFGSIMSVKNSSSPKLNEGVKSVKENIILFFKRDKNIIERLKVLNEKESIWFMTGYAKNVFSHHSFYNIVGFEEIKEISPNKLSLTNKINFNDLLSKKINHKDSIKNDSYSIVNAYKVKKYVIFFKNENKNNDVVSNNNGKNDSTKDFILFTYMYFIFYIYDKEGKTFYIYANNLNKDHIIYEINELNSENLFNFFDSKICNKKDLKNISVISLIRKNNTLKNIVENISTNELLNVNNYTNKFNSYLKKLFHMCNNSDILLENKINVKQRQPCITLIYGNKNFMLKGKTYFEYLKNFFLKNEEDKNLFENIFLNNKGYKFYIQNDLNDNSSYILKCTKITKKKFDQLHKSITNFDNKNCTTKDPFFTYSKILFDIYKNKSDNEKKKKGHSCGENYCERSIYINIGANDYMVDNNLPILKKADETLLFSVTKHFLNYLVSCIHM
ncbi:hypothetical protein MKS88_001852 [Plasmodium brasilianum]|uniref:Uncharacterized protein n=1 Tax=Plasmodium brasilianum TaxID=5824 RepID=A0ACB9YDM4_PLABR|nr:hypothetical protein MKS88_001852 [Plasmodium brasilianum]